MTRIAEVRQWAQGATDDELITFVRAVRELHVSWLHAETSTINLQLEIESWRYEGEQTSAAHATTLSERDTARDALAASEAQCDALRSQLSQKEHEIGSLTMSLQQAILEHKGAAENTQRAKQKK